MAPRGPLFAAFDQPTAPRGTAFRLQYGGFRPNISVTIHVTRPDGVQDAPRTSTTGSDGSGSYQFDATDQTTILGTYNVLVIDGNTGDSAEAQAVVTE